MDKSGKAMLDVYYIGMSKLPEIMGELIRSGSFEELRNARHK